MVNDTTRYTFKLNGKLITNNDAKTYPIIRLITKPNHGSNDQNKLYDNATDKPTRRATSFISCLVLSPIKWNVKITEQFYLILGHVGRHKREAINSTRDGKQLFLLRPRQVTIHPILESLQGLQFILQKEQ